MITIQFKNLELMLDCKLKFGNFNTKTNKYKEFQAKPSQASSRTMCI